MACATSSPRITCSVKFFEPTTMLVLAGARGDADQADTPTSTRPPRPPATTACAAATPRVRSRCSSQARHAVGAERQRRRRNGAGQDRRGVDHRQAAEDVLAEAARADRRGNRRRADADHRGHANAGDDRRQRERQLDHEQQLPRRHAHRHAGFDDRRVEALQMPVTVVRTIGSSA